MKFISECIWLCSHKLICICPKSSKITWHLYYMFNTKQNGFYIWCQVCTNTLYYFTNEVIFPGERIYTAIDSLIIGTWMMSYIYHHLECAAWYTALLIIFTVSIINYTETIIMIITKKDQCCTVSFLQSCNKIAWQNPMNEKTWKIFYISLSNKKLFSIYLKLSSICI